MMAWFASILLLFMIHIVQADGDPLTINVKQEIDDLCGCNHGCNTCDGRKCGNMGSPCGAGLMGTCRDKHCWEDEEKIDGEKCCHGEDCVCCQCKGGCGGNCTNGVEQGTCMKEGHGRRIIKNAYCKGYSCQCGAGCHGKCGYGDLGLCMEISGNRDRTPIDGDCDPGCHCCAENGGNCTYPRFWGQSNTECSKYGASPTGIFRFLPPFTEECCRSHEVPGTTPEDVTTLGTMPYDVTPVACNTGTTCGADGEEGKCSDSCGGKNQHEIINATECHGGADCVCCTECDPPCAPNQQCVKGNKCVNDFGGQCAAAGGFCTPECLWPYEEEVPGNHDCPVNGEECCREREPSTAPPTTTLPPGTTPIRTTPVDACNTKIRCGASERGNCSEICIGPFWQRIPDHGLCEGEGKSCECCAPADCILPDVECGDGGRCKANTCSEDERPIDGDCEGASCVCCKLKGCLKPEAPCGVDNIGKCRENGWYPPEASRKIDDDGKCLGPDCACFEDCDPPCKNGGTCCPNNTCCCTNVTSGDRCEIYCPRKENVVDGDGFGFHFCVKTYQEAHAFCGSHGWALATPDRQFFEFNEVMPARYEFWLDVLPNATSSKFAKVTETGVWYWQTTPPNLTIPEQWQEDYVPPTPPFCASMYKDYHLAGNICERKWFFVCEGDVFEEGREVGNFTAAYHQEQPSQRNPERHLKV